MKKEEMIGVLSDTSKLLEYIIENDEVEYKVNSVEFSELVKRVSYYKVDEIIDYLQTLIDLEKKSTI